MEIGQTIIVARGSIIEIDNKGFTEEQLLKMKTIKVKNLDLSYKGLTELPSWVSKCEVAANFDCSNNKLTSLKGSPKSVGGNFDCSHNKLTSVVGAPTTIGGDFDCSYNKLKSMKGGPKHLGGNFFGDHNPN